MLCQPAIARIAVTLTLSRLAVDVSITWKHRHKGHAAPATLWRHLHHRSSESIKQQLLEKL